MQSNDFQQVKGGNPICQSIVLILIQVRMLFACFVARAPSWLLFSCCLPGSPGFFKQNCYQTDRAQTALLQKVIPPQTWTLPLSLLNFIRFLLAHSSAHLSPYERWPYLAAYQLFPTHFVPFTNLMSLHSTTSSRSLIKDVEHDISHFSPLHLLVAFTQTTTL